MKYFYLLTALITSLSLQAIAEDKSKDKAALAKSGTLSSSIDAGFADTKAAEPWGGDAIGAQAAPISGSVSRLNQREWGLYILNESEDKYRLHVEVAQYSKTGRKIKGDSFSYTLKPGAKVQRTVRSAQGTQRADLKLKSWKNLTPPEENVEPESSVEDIEAVKPPAPAGGVVPGVPTKKTRSF